MIFKAFPCILFAVTILFRIKISSGVDVFDSPQEFCYFSGKPCANWPLICASGTRQSPIDLTVPKSQPLGDPVHLPLTHFKSDHFFMQNNGHTINLDFTPAMGKQVNIFPGYGLTTTKYRFANAHFHWGKNNNEGSEHTIYGKKYAMEMHLVHYNRKYATMKKAVASGDRNALAVVGILFEVDQKLKHHKALEPIINNLKEMQEKHKYWLKVEQPLDLTPLIPKKDVKVFSYQGSLTTPTCNEQVNWYVFEKPVKIGKADLDAFRGVVDGQKLKISRNHRGIQKPNGRKIDLFMLK